MSNIYSKLQDMRVALQSMNIKKSGENKFAGYKYYELGDFMPSINQLMKEHGVCGVISYGAEEATLTLFNSEKPEETIVFASPMKEAVLKGAHPIQNLGAVETYQRRYLYMTAFEIVEADVLDATQGSGSNPTPAPAQNQKSARGGAQRATQQRKPNNKLPEDLSEELNTAIRNTKAITGMTVNEVVAELERRTGMKMQDVTVETAQAVFNALNEMTDEVPF